MMKNIVLAAALWAASTVVMAAGGMQLLEAKPDIHDQASMQNGA